MSVLYNRFCTIVQVITAQPVDNPLYRSTHYDYDRILLMMIRVMWFLRAAISDYGFIAYSRTRQRPYYHKHGYMYFQVLFLDPKLIDIYRTVRDIHHNADGIVQ